MEATVFPFCVLCDVREMSVIINVFRDLTFEAIEMEIGLGRGRSQAHSKTNIIGLKFINTDVTDVSMQGFQHRI